MTLARSGFQCSVFSQTANVPFLDARSRKWKQRMDVMSQTVVLETSLPGLPVRRGKVRDVYDLGDRLLLVSTDRITRSIGCCRPAFPIRGGF